MCGMAVLQHGTESQSGWGLNLSHADTRAVATFFSVPLDTISKILFNNFLILFLLDASFEISLLKLALW